MGNVIKSLFNRTFSHSRKTVTPDGAGNFPTGWASLGTFEGRIRPANASEKETAAVQGREISHVLYTEGGLDIARGDQVTAGGLVVEVLGIRPPSDPDHHIAVDCLEKQVEEVTDG